MFAVSGCARPAGVQGFLRCFQRRVYLNYAKTIVLLANKTLLGHLLGVRKVKLCPYFVIF